VAGGGAGDVVVVTAARCERQGTALTASLELSCLYSVRVVADVGLVRVVDADQRRARPGRTLAALCRAGENVERMRAAWWIQERLGAVKHARWLGSRRVVQPGRRPQAEISR
jgi:hypothetical protein